MVIKNNYIIFKMLKGGMNCETDKWGGNKTWMVPI